MSLTWLVIGGGIHGVHVAARLIGERHVGADQLRIVDPAERLLARWRACTSTTGMTHLRSPAVHHIGLSPWSLRQFAEPREPDEPDLYAPPYRRPALDLFDEHCDQVVEDFGLAALHVQDRALRCEVDCDRVVVELAGGDALEAHQVVLAIGASEQPRWPAWAPRGHDCVQHVFEPGFAGWPAQESESVIVVGGGLSACQVALRLVGEGHRVEIVSRHPVREHQFDSDPGWLGAKYMTGFSRVEDFDRRRAIIAGARHGGSVPPEVRHALRDAIQREAIGWHQADIAGLGDGEDGLELELSTGVTLHADRVLLATGFDPRRPGGALVDALIASASLPCAECGYPIVDDALRWHPRIRVTGPLAELELGPSSRNIAGARRAADRIIGCRAEW